MIERNVAAIILYDEENRVLLQHREDDAPTFPGYWSLFGGGIEGEETPKQALGREIREEIEYEVRNPEMVKIQDYTNDGLFGKIYLFLEKYDGRTKLVLHEGEEMQWFKIEETEKLLLNETNRQALLLAQEYFACTKRSDKKF